MKAIRRSLYEGSATPGVAGLRSRPAQLRVDYLVASVTSGAALDSGSPRRRPLPPSRRRMGPRSSRSALPLSARVPALGGARHTCLWQSRRA